MLHVAEGIACSEINTKHINTVRGQNVKFLTVGPVGASRNQ